MADAQLLEMLNRFDATLTQQGQMLTSLAAQTTTLTAQAATSDARFASGETGVQALIAALEARLIDTETRTAAALAAREARTAAALEARLAATEKSMTDAMVALSASLDQRLATMQQVAATMASAAAAPATWTAPAAQAFQGAAVQPNAGGPPSTPTASTTAPPVNVNAPTFDPWAPYTGAPTGAPPGMPAPPGGAQYFQLQGTEGLKAKDFLSVQVFNGDVNSFADWADRMASKLARGHPQLASMLLWAERREEPITLVHEQEVSVQGVDVVGISGALFDVMMERTGPRIYDKRCNAGKGRGLEFWRILKRDFGTESANAQLAKQRMYTMPARCASVHLLGDALDKWEALGRDIHSPIPENFHLIALQQLVPKGLAETMAAQPSLTKFSEALAFVRRQVADHRHANQVQAVQRQAPVAMDVSALAAALACWQGEAQQDDEQWPDHEMTPTDQFIAAAWKGSKGKGKGKGDSKGKGEDRECYNCGVRGHLAANCPAPPKAKGGQKGDAKGTKGKGKGKGWDVQALTEDDGEAFSLGCLMRAEETPLSAVTTQQPEVWQDYEVVEAMIDSGAGECVCGPQHFSGIDMTVNPNRASAGTEYICADGARIRNQGEKLVPGLSDEGSSMSINFQVTQVEMPLIAVSRLTAIGHQVWFGGDHGVITHGSSGKQTKFFKKKGVFVLRIWVPRASPASAAALSGGMRQ
jgi:hypothetical protein